MQLLGMHLVRIYLIYVAYKDRLYIVVEKFLLNPDHKLILFFDELSKPDHFRCMVLYICGFIVMESCNS